MAQLTFDDVHAATYTGAGGATLMCLPFSGPTAVVPHTRPCAVCLWGYAFVRWAKKESVFASMTDGCQFCKLVWAVAQSYAAPLEDSSGIGIYHYGSSIDVAWSLTGTERTSSRVRVHGVPDQGPFATMPGLPVDDVPPVLRDVAGKTASDDALEWVKGKLAECESEHEKCRETLTTGLPSRVLDVGEPNGGMARVSESDAVRLIETDNNLGDYVCLSHCWGPPGQGMFKTTKENIGDRMQQISISEVPNTFKDAVEITRRLGKRYLWIDSLCIIQNDHRDWQKEGLRMHEIYGNAFLTIAASGSREPSEGIFSASERHALRDFPFQYGTEVCNMQTRVVIRHLESASDFPLLRRGWVFQERILSRRVLHFGPGEIIWECMTTEDCECGGVAELDMHSNIPRKSLFRGENKLNIFLWATVVMGYSSLDLTKENDIFPALSGIAQQHKPNADARYCAGLWDGEFFLYGLLWRVDPKYSTVYADDSRDTLLPRPSPYRAPSWSWASVSNKVTYEITSHCSSEVQTMGPKIIHAGRGSFGEVIYGEFKIRGPATLITCHQPADQRQKNLEVRCNDELMNGMVVHPDYDWASEQTWWVSDGQPLFALKLAVTRGDGGKDSWDPDADVFAPKDTVHFLLLARFTDLDDSDSEETLLLQRVGMATLTWEKFTKETSFREELQECEFAIF